MVCGTFAVMCGFCPIWSPISWGGIGNVFLFLAKHGFTGWACRFRIYGLYGTSVGGWACKSIANATSGLLFTLAAWPVPTLVSSPDLVMTANEMLLSKTLCACCNDGVHVLAYMLV